MVRKVDLGKQIVVSAANKIGVLADMSKLITQHGLNIEAVAGYVTDQEAKIMLLTDDNLRAMDALKKAGYKSIKEEEVIVMELENKPGALKYVTEQLATKNVDIKYTYGTVCSSNCPAKLIISSSDNDKALVALKK
jgi:hypothetical protein